MNAAALRFQAKRHLLKMEGEPTMEELVRAKWAHEHDSRRRRGDYRDLASLSRGIAGQFSKFTRLLNSDIEGDRHELLYSDFALFFGEALLDLAHAAEEIGVKPGEARFLQQVLLNTAGILDDLFGKDLQGSLERDLKELFIEATPEAMAPPESFRNTIATIANTYATMAEDVYQLILA